MISDTFKSDWKLDVCVSGKASHDIKKLVPLIFSHGYGGNLHDYSTTCRMLASYGYLVITINHNDGSCSYTEKEDGTAIPYDNTKKWGH